MKTRRLLITSFVFLAIGLGLICGFCNGTAGFSASFPFSGSELKLAITTTGFPAISGFVITVIGLVLLVISVLAAIFGEIFSPKHRVKQDQPVHPA